MWSTHADVDVERRRVKARKIHAVLNQELPGGILDLLEIGTGSGVMAEYFARMSPIRFNVRSVDVVDLRVVSDGYHFTLVNGANLPYPDESFDVVISNHVLEHVGERNEQAAHLSEVARVLRPGGVAYLATPNRWAVMEPHFGLPFLSWLPSRLSDVYLRVFRRGDRYDCWPVGPAVLSRLSRAAGLDWRHIESEAVSADANAHAMVRRLAQTMGSAIGRLWVLLPTFVVLMRRSANG